MQPYTVDYFIDKFEAIPDEKWGTGYFYNPTRDTKCALGHCSVTGDIDTTEGDALIAIFNDAGHSAAAVNDNYTGGTAHDYPGGTPKARILNVLRQIKAKQNLLTPQPTA